MAVKLPVNFADYHIDYSSIQFEEEKKFILLISSAKEFKINPEYPQMFIINNDGIEFVLDPISTDSLALLVDVLIATRAKHLKDWEVAFNTLVGLCKLARLHPNYDDAQAGTALSRCIREFIRFGFNLNQIYSNGAAPLHMAAHHNLSELIFALGANGALVDVHSAKKYTPLHVACSWNHAEAVQALLFLGADPNARASKNMTPLLAGAESAKIIGLLAKRGADLNFERPSKSPKIAFESEWRGARTAVESAVRKESFAALKIFIHLHVRITPQNYSQFKELIITKIHEKVVEFRTTDSKWMRFIPRIVNLINMLGLLIQNEEGTLKSEKLELPLLSETVDEAAELYLQNRLEQLELVASSMPYKEGWKKTVKSLQGILSDSISVLKAH